MTKDIASSPLPDFKNVSSLVARPRCQVAAFTLTRRIYMASHFRSPGGHFFLVCGGSVKTFYQSFSFSRLWERRA